MSTLAPVSETYWNIPGYIIFWVLFFIAFVLFVKRVCLLLRLLRLGKRESRFDKIGQRIKAVLVEFLLGWCSLRHVPGKDVAGVGHAFLVWGFGLFIIGYIVFIGLGEGFGFSTVFAGTQFEKVCLSILDIAGVFVIIALIWAIAKRYIVKPKRLEESTREGGLLLPLIFTFMFALIVFHYSLESIGFALSKLSGSWPPLGKTFSNVWVGTGISKGTLLELYKGIWWMNYGIILGFLIYAPYSKHLHPLFSPANIFFKSIGRSKGTLKPVTLGRARTFGSAKIHDLTWKQLLDLYACTDCGRCQENCPAYVAQKPLSPWKVIKDLRNHLLDVPRTSESAPLELVENVVRSEAIWSCTTCLACQDVCPVHIEHPHTLIDLRRAQVDQGACPSLCATALEGIANRGNPWAMPPTDRINWAENLKPPVLKPDDEVEWLYWVGCSSSYEPVAQDISRAFVTLLKQAGLSYGLLGTKERCCGDPARRIGEEGLFQKTCGENISIFNDHKVKKIITQCPHCYNIFKNEYPLMGGQYEVYHHSQLLPHLLGERKLELTKTLKYTSVLYQDPCYLSRYNQSFQDARHVIQILPDLHLLNPKGGAVFCCGAGGGQMWLDVRDGERMENVRFAQIERLAPGVLATACPFCKIMFDTAAASRPVAERKRVPPIKDIAELLLEAV